jgi:YVTN family beta-propeller protein
MRISRSRREVAVTPDGSKAYFTQADPFGVSVIDTATNTVIATVPVGTGPQGVAVTLAVGGPIPHCRGRFAESDCPPIPIRPFPLSPCSVGRTISGQSAACRSRSVLHVLRSRSLWRSVGDEAAI